MTDDRLALWEEFKREHPHGSRLVGIVKSVHQFGVGVDLGGPFVGLLLAPYVSRSHMGEVEFPSVGQQIEVMIRHYGDDIVPGSVGTIALTQRPGSLWVHKK